MGCWKWLDAAFSLDGTLGKQEYLRRRMFFNFNLGMLVVSVMYSFVMSSVVFSLPLSGLVQVVYVVSSLLAIGVVLLKYKLTSFLIMLVVLGYAFAILLCDLMARALSYSLWPYAVLLVDLMLVMKVPSSYSVVIVCVIIGWLVLMMFEESFRFGMLDMPGLWGPEKRREILYDKAACALPPCPTTPRTASIVGVLVFGIDFLATRGFARDVLKEQASMAQTINTVQEIASLLAGYDVEKVAELLEVHGADLPEGMLLALSTLEANLRVYKAYLPQTCLPFAMDATQDTSQGGTDTDSQTEASGRESTMDGSGSTLLAGVATARSLGLSHVKATLLMLNVKGTLHLLEDGARFSELFTALLLRALSATELQRGMVDVFIGDRIHCSFNTSRPCASHATSALHTATLLLKGIGRCESFFNIGIATGKVLRGDMGCEMMRRFSMIGTLVRDVNGMERAGRILGCDVLCNRLCFSDGELEHQLRLIPRKVEVDAGCDEEVVAELVVPDGSVGTEQEADEWMYMIGGKKPFDDFNSSVRAYLRGDVSVEELTATARLANAPHNVMSTVGRETLRLPARAHSTYDTASTQSLFLQWTGVRRVSIGQRSADPPPDPTTTPIKGFSADVSEKS